MSASPPDGTSIRLQRLQNHMRPLHLTKRTKWHSRPRGSSASRRPQSSPPRCSHYLARGQCHLQLGENVAPTRDSLIGNWLMKILPLRISWYHHQLHLLFSDAPKTSINNLTQQPQPTQSCQALHHCSCRWTNHFQPTLPRSNTPLVEAPVLHFSASKQQSRPQNPHLSRRVVIVCVCVTFVEDSQKKYMIFTQLSGDPSVDIQGFFNKKNGKPESIKQNWGPPRNQRAQFWQCQLVKWQLFNP